ncbi:MAG: hypothetical protein WCA46_09655 [Actinocatenispora sp.]
MVSPRRSIPAATEAALWALSNGRCYAPSCPFPVVYEVRPGVYRKNAQVAHIYGVKPGAPRYCGMPDDERDAFKNLLLLCLAHHGEVDDKKTGEHHYPPEMLHKWKREHEGGDAPALAMLGAVGDEELTDLLVGVFTPAVDRLQAIADQLEETGTLTAGTVQELRGVVDVLARGPNGPDAATAATLAHAAEIFAAINLTNSATALAQSADTLSSLGLERLAATLARAAQQAINASEYLR